MGVYNNNKDGTRSTLANTIQVVDAPMEQFVSRGEFSAVTPSDVSADNKLVAENEVTKTFDTMPTASASLVGTIVQYVGTTTANYTNGYFYKCVSDGAITPTYSWVEVISGSGGEKEIVHVDTLPVSPNIEDKVYEVGPVGDVMTITTPPNGTNFRDYFSQFPFFTIGINSDTGKYYADTSQEYFVCMTNVGGAIWSGRADLITIEDASTSTATNVYILYQNRSTGEFRNMSLPANISITLEVALLEDSNKYYIGNATNQTLFELKNGIGEVAVTPTLQSGIKIAEIDVDGTTTNLYAPDISNLATKSEVQAKQDVVQYSELPTPSSTLEGKVLQYIGDGTPSKAVVTVIDDGGNKSSTNTGILSYLQNKNIPLNIGVNTYQIGSSNKYYTLAELQALEEQGSEIIMRGGTDSSFSTDAATVEAFTQDAEAVKTYAETNGFNTKLRIYPQGIRVYGGTDVDEKIGVLNDLGVEMAFNLECNVEMYDMSHSHPGYEEWYEYANGHDAGLGIANVAPFVTMPNGYSKGLMLNRAEMTHAKLKDTQRVADINTMIQAHRYVVLFGHSYQSEWTTAGDDGKTTTELFESFIDDLTETYGDEILWMTPTQAWNYFNSLPKTGHFYKCVAENNTYTWQEIPSVSEVTVTPTLSTGTKIGSISVDGNETDLFAPSGSGSASDFDKFCDNIDIDYAFDSATNANYTVIRIYKDKLDGTKQYPFVYAPNGAEPCQKSTYEIAHEDGWFLAINSGIFDTTTHIAKGMLIQNGVVLQNTPEETYNSRPLTIDEDGNLAEVAYDADATTLVNNGVISAVCGFMAIVKNYETVPSSEWNNVAHYTQNAQRQIIGQFGNGDYAIITCEGRNFDHSDGWTIAEAQAVCQKIGLKFAYNLDGGGSTETMFGLKHINQIYEGTTGRKVPTFIVFNGTSSFTPPTPIVKKLSFISATKTQTQYDVGDTLSTSDIVVTAYYTDGTHTNVTNSSTINTSSVDMSTAGTYLIVISYTEDNVTKTTSISIAVSAPSVKTLTSISATKTQTSYDVGDTLSTSDIVVTAHYSDNTSAVVTSSATIDTSDVDMSAQGTYLIVVSYTEDGITETTSISISVGEVVADYDFIYGYGLESSGTAIVAYASDKRVATVTQTPNEMPISVSGTSTQIGYLIPVPTNATAVKVTVSSGYAPGIGLVTSGLTDEYSLGWASSNVARASFMPNRFSYLNLAIRNSGNTTIPSDVDTSSWSIEFTYAENRDYFVQTGYAMGANNDSSMAMQTMASARAIMLNKVQNAAEVTGYTNSSKTKSATLGYLIPVPSTATSVTAYLPSDNAQSYRYIAGIGFWNIQDGVLKRVLDGGWGNETTTTRTFTAGTYQYLSVNIKNSSDTELSPNAPINDWTVTFE